MTTTLSQHTDSNESQHEQAKRAIVQALHEDARGRSNAISSADLAERTPVSASTVRDLVVEVIEEYRLPVGNANGYFVIEEVGELDRQVNRQTRQAETSMRRARLIAAAWNRGNHDE